MITFPRPLDYVGNPIEFSYFAFPSTADEVKSLIMSLPNKKCNCDDVPILVYKLLVDRISIMISDIPIQPFVTEGCIS